MLRIEELDINNIGPFDRLRLKFNNRMNIICGQNGVGKTTILNMIRHSNFSKSTNLKRNVNSYAGSWKINIAVNDITLIRNFTINNQHPNEVNFFFYSQSGRESDRDSDLIWKNIISVQSMRLDTLERLVNNSSNKQETIYGIEIERIKLFIVNAHNNQRPYFPALTNAFNKIDGNIKFSKIENNNVFVQTKSGEIYLEYLSKGFLSCLNIIIEITYDIFNKTSIELDSYVEYEGVILIDEIELHLHPEWQVKICSILSGLFCKAQFIITTHSPHILQMANPNQIISLVYDDNMEVKLNPSLSEKYGYQGWSVEEILIDVMNLKETRSELYLETSENLSKALNEGNTEIAKELFKVMDEMLHPHNIYRKILRIQLAGLGINDQINSR